MENGDFWTRDMNSYNHYAYGAVADWVYGNAAGIRPLDGYPAYEKISVSPLPDKRLGWLSCSYRSRHGLIRSDWKLQGDQWQSSRLPVRNMKLLPERGSSSVR